MSTINTWKAEIKMFMKEQKSIRDREIVNMYGKLAAVVVARHSRMQWVVPFNHTLLTREDAARLKYKLFNTMELERCMRAVECEIVTNWAKKSSPRPFSGTWEVANWSYGGRMSQVATGVVHDGFVLRIVPQSAGSQSDAPASGSGAVDDSAGVLVV